MFLPKSIIIFETKIRNHLLLNEHIHVSIDKPNDQPPIEN